VSTAAPFHRYGVLPPQWRAWSASSSRLSVRARAQRRHAREAHPSWERSGDFGFIGEYVVTEYLPTSPGNRVATAPISFTVEVKVGETTYVEFGNGCLSTDGYTPAGADARDHQESLKNALDSANNNYNFVQPAPCCYPDDTWEWELPSS
jgi:hypothetical protein